jgi:hypothetical protein
VRRAERAEQAAALRRRGLTQDAIAQELGISRSYVAALLDDPLGEKDRQRKTRYSGTCESCGNPTTGCNGHANAPTRCAACTCAMQHAARYWTRETIVTRFKEFHAATGRAPTSVDAMCKIGAPSIAAQLSTARLREIEAIPDTVALPPPSIVCREFDSWHAALRAAGFTPNRGGAPGHRERRSAMRRFVVLEKNGVGFKPRETVEAITSAAAIQAVADGEGVFVAVPEHHWQERRVVPKTVFAVAEEHG